MTTKSQKKITAIGNLRDSVIPIDPKNSMIIRNQKDRISQTEITKNQKKINYGKEEIAAVDTKKTI